VDAELKRRVEALRRPLELAAADNFAGVRRVHGLGHVLRIACDQVIAKAPVDGLAQWRAQIDGWEQLDETQQAVAVAKGMRLLARIPRPAGATIERQIQRALPVPQRPSSPSPEPAAQAGQAGQAQLAIGTTPAGAAKRTAVPKRATAAKPTTAASEASNATATSAASNATKSKPARAAKPAAVETEDPLAAPTYSLPGIGPAFAERLAEKNLVTVEDLLWCLPRRYDDVRDAKALAEVCAMPEGERATFTAKVTSSRMVFARGRRWGEVRLEAVGEREASGGNVLGDRASAVVRWFNVFAGIDKRMPPGATVVLSGLVKRRNGRPEFANPDILGIEVPAPAQPALGSAAAAPKPLPSILARYPDVAGVPGSRLRQACATACARVGASVDDGVPAHVEAAAQLPSLFATLSQLHAPPSDTPADELAAMNRGDSRWQRRLAFGELFALGVAVAIRRRERRGDTAVPCPRVAGLDRELATAMPFALTGAQRRVIDELAGDLARATPMNRLLQGDVGAGKTAVAFAAALQVARAGRQTAVMAPTELLAEQHADTWRRWAGASGLRIELLTASTPKGVRASLLALLAAGQVDVVIGTHALIAERVGFHALGLVIIDEQHRFGVAQRAKLRDKGDGIGAHDGVAREARAWGGAPHLLVMTATPIPRTLALTAFGDLDTSVLDELPPGRTPVTTKLATGARGLAAAYKLIAERVAAGERAYVVCPKVEPTDDADEPTKWKDATTVAGELAAALPSARVGLVHGRLDAATRDRVMRAFKQGELDVLCATTVIEVGVDVPAATVMVIHDADRFGLAQLHQLRGRVGRGSGAAHCVLLAQGTLGEDAESRLAIMVETTDGFRIAEADLLQRGPGELLGPRQAGVPRLRYGDLHQHTELLLEARRHADAILDGDPDLARPEHASLRRALDRRLAQSVYGAEGG